jgi:8-oxo-dGTP pyrophosphatase MutT (NUDIX family)
MIKPWPCIRSQINQSFGFFSIRTDTTISPRTGLEHDFYVIESRDWVNVIPITNNHQVIMIKQYRHGSRKVALEIPGGLLDPGDTPKKGAARELLEETGFQSKKLKQIGVVRPNPALFNNRCYTFLAQDIQKVADPKLDQTEDIEVVPVPLADISGFILKGKIDHAMVMTAFAWYFLRKPEGWVTPR